jgi:pilus assembly protein CpaE
MRRPNAHGMESQSGQATVEFLGTLPAALLVVLVGWQFVLAGHTTWLAGNAARVAARAGAVGGDPKAAARSALPSYLRRRLEVSREGERGERIRVRVRLPLLLHRFSSPITIGAGASMQAQEP